MRLAIMFSTGMLAAALLGAPARAQQQQQAPPPAQVKMPQTAAEHLAMAKTYRDKAAAYRQEAADHHAMAEAYKKSVPRLKGQDNPWAVKMEEHCRKLADDAERLAAEADELAQFHTLRARELQGK